MPTINMCVRRARREQVPETNTRVVSAISVACTGESPGRTIACYASSGVSDASDMAPVSHGWPLEGHALAWVMLGCGRGSA